MIATIALGVVMVVKEVKFHNAGIIQNNITFIEAVDNTLDKQSENLKRPKLVSFI